MLYPALTDQQTQLEINCFNTQNMHDCNKKIKNTVIIYLIAHTNTCAHTYILFRSLKFTLKLLKRSYMFRTHDHPRGTYIVPC